MNLFRFAKYLLLLPVFFSISFHISISIIFFYAELYHLNPFDFVFMYPTLIMSYFIEFLRTLPLIVYAIAMSVNSASEVERKMTYYGIIILVVSILGSIRTFIVYQLGVSIYSQIYNFIILGSALVLIIIAIVLPHYSQHLQRHRKIVLAYPVVKIIGVLVLDTLLISFSRAQIGMIIFSIIYSFVLAVFSAILLFVLIDSTETVFDTVETGSNETLWPEA